MSRPTVVTVTETPRNPGSYEVNVERDGKMVVGRARGNTAQLRLRDGVSSCHFPVEASPSFSSPAGQ